MSGSLNLSSASNHSIDRSGSEADSSSVAKDNRAIDRRLKSELHKRVTKSEELTDLYLSPPLGDLNPRYSRIEWSKISESDGSELGKCLQILYAIEAETPTLGASSRRHCYLADVQKDPPLPPPASSQRDQSARRPNICILSSSSPPSCSALSEQESLEDIWKSSVKIAEGGERVKDRRLTEHVEVFGELSSSPSDGETGEVRQQLNRMLVMGLETPGRIEMLAFSICGDFLTVSLAHPDGLDVSDSINIVANPTTLIHFLWIISFGDIINQYRIFQTLIDINSTEIQQHYNLPITTQTGVTTSAHIPTGFMLTIPPHFQPRLVGYTFPSASAPPSSPPSADLLLKTIGSSYASDGSITFIVCKVLCYRTSITGRCTTVFAVRYLGNDGSTREGVLKISMIDPANPGEEETVLKVINAASREKTENLSRTMLMFVEGSYGTTIGRSSVRRRPVISLLEERFHLCSEARSPLELAKILMDGIQGHSQLYSAGFLHRDVSLGNLLLSVDISSGKRVVRGILSDYDLALDFRNVGPTPVSQFTGTYPFLSRQILDDIDAETPHHHTQMDDFESIFFVGAIVVLLHCAEVTKYSATTSALKYYSQWNDEPVIAAISKEVTRPALRRMFRDGHTSWLPLLPFLEVFRKAILTEDPTTINHDELLVILQAGYDSLALQP